MRHPSAPVDDLAPPTVPVVDVGIPLHLVTFSLDSPEGSNARGAKRTQSSSARKPINDQSQ